jgi:hypothetical protein
MNETDTVFRITKNTGSHGDVFAAVGLADLLASSASAGTVSLFDAGSAFEVRLDLPFDGTLAAAIPQAPGYPFLKANSKTQVPKGAQDPVDYPAEKAKADRQKKIKLEKRKKVRGTVDAATQQQVQEEQLRDDWRLLQVLNVLQGDETSNRVHEVIVKLTPEQFQRKVSLALRSLLKGEPSGLTWEASTVQVFNPLAAKGYSRLKPDSTDRNDKTKEHWSDPFNEWLKYRGYFRVATPYFQGSKGEHVRLVCPIPRDIRISALISLARELRRSPIYGASGAPKVDALAVLRLAELLVRHSEEYRGEDVDVWPGLTLKDKTPADVISGVMVTHYQAMGNAKAVGTMSAIALPGWFEIEGPEDAGAWLEILEEHQAVVRGLQGDHSDEIGLLIQYRRFLEHRGESSLWALLDFMGGYGPFLIRAREQRRRVRSFRTDYLRRIIMGTTPSLEAVLNDAGFQAVASAIRKSTVSAQALKAMGERDYREIRYDLLPDLRRKRSLPGPQPLLEAVSDFISKYNTENARRREMKKRAPRNVTTEEFTSFTALVEKRGSSTVGALLCAYASCREPRDEDSLAGMDSPPEQDTNEQAAS